MKAERGPVRSPAATNNHLDRKRSATGGQTWNASRTIVAALEALEDGDVGLCAAILLGALEDFPRPTGVRCPSCGQRFDWPGLRDAHRCPNRFEAAA